jgi:D-alanyl-D-alanine-carboxypeptidase/D-alanyl-D-alanine-endopeptidase
MADTLFEIGSITKVFTALLLADASLRGELALSDPVSRWLPEGSVVPGFEGAEITLTVLATHASGLPSFMAGAPPFGEDSSTGYTVTEMLADVAAFPLPGPVGAAWSYSNTGYGLIGLALERATGRPYERLLHERILDPLGMNSTAITLPPPLEDRTATPHGLDQSPAPRLNVSAMACAGAVWSCADDMLSFLAAAAGLRPSALTPAFDAMLAVRGPSPKIEGAQVQQALGWLVASTSEGDLLTHNGGTVGMASSAYVDPSAKAAVIVLSNAGQSVNDFALHILRPDRPLKYSATPTPRVSAPVGRDLMARCAGRYELAPGAVLDVALDERGLIFRAPDSPRLRLTPAGGGVFFIAAFALDVAFDLEADGPAASLSFKRGEQPLEARRLEG